jgi:hypothetical protein
MTDIGERLRYYRKHETDLQKQAALTFAADEIERLHNDYAILKADWDKLRAEAFQLKQAAADAVMDNLANSERSYNEAFALRNEIDRLLAEVLKLTLEINELRKTKEP